MVDVYWRLRTCPQYRSIVRISPIHPLTATDSLNRALNVIEARHARGDKSRGALLGLVPFFVTWTLIPAYLWLNPEILYNHLVPFVFFAGLVNAYSVGQMITAHLVILPFPYYNVLVLPLAYGVLDSLGPFLQRNIGLGWPSALGDGTYQVAYVFSMLGTAIGVYGSFVVSCSSCSSAHPFPASTSIVADKP